MQQSNRSDRGNSRRTQESAASPHAEATSQALCSRMSSSAGCTRAGNQAQVHAACKTRPCRARACARGARMDQLKPPATADLLQPTRHLSIYEYTCHRLQASTPICIIRGHHRRQPSTPTTPHRRRHHRSWSSSTPTNNFFFSTSDAALIQAEK